jgi:hypothetical protein
MMDAPTERGGYSLGRAQKSLRVSDGRVRTFFAVQLIFKPERDRQNLNRQQNGGARFDGRCFAAILALLARG